jgi:hypothetical protein
LKKFTISLLAMVALAISAFAQNTGPQITVNIDPHSVGTVVNATTKQILGTAFIAGKNKPRLYTCWHVGAIGDLTADKEYRSVTGGPESAPFVSEVKPIFAAIGYDLEAFEVLSPMNFRALEFGDAASVRPGDTVIYLGYRAANNTLQASPATIQAVGSVLNDGVITTFLEFAGEGVPGYSGGPVFDKNGKVVALMREAWTMKGLQPGSQEVLMNRAYSTALLKTFDSEVSAITPAGAQPKHIGP